jgi:cell division protein FtsN
MLLLYSILKLVLGISSGGEHIVLPERRPDEVVAEMAGSENVATPSSRSTKPSQSLPQGFVFLDINGNPIGGETKQTEEATVSPTNSEGNTGNWVVQAASFREEEKAQALVEKLEAKGITATVAKSGSWYVVRLPTQEGREEADRQLKQLRGLGVRGMIKPAE